MKFVFEYKSRIQMFVFDIAAEIMARIRSSLISRSIVSVVR